MIPPRSHLPRAAALPPPCSPHATPAPRSPLGPPDQAGSSSSPLTLGTETDATLRRHPSIYASPYGQHEPSRYTVGMPGRDAASLIASASVRSFLARLTNGLTYCAGIRRTSW